jgi:hypothetical protein
LAALVASVVGLAGMTGVGGARAAGGLVFVSPTGGGDGSSPASPLDLASAFSSTSPAAGGGTVSMAAGVYWGCFGVDASGTPATPLVVRPLPGVRAVIDSAGCSGDTALTINGDDVWVWGVEVTNSDPTRASSEPGSDPAGYRRGNGVNIYGARDKLINAWVHGNANGVGLWDQATDTEVYGTIITDSGWIGPDRGHGHGIYVQNQNGAGKQVNDTIVLSSYGIGVHAYATAGHVIGLLFDGLVVADSGSPAGNGANDTTRNPNMLIGTEQNPADQVTVANSVFYQPAGMVGGSLRAGYGVAAGAVTITGNYLAGGAQALEITNWQQVQVTDNTFYATSSANPNASPELAFVQGVNPAAISWNNNTYHDTTGTEPFAYNGTVAPNGSQLLTWPDWYSNTGFDSQSTYTQTAPPDNAIIRPNRYEPGRANITVLNWSGQPNTSVDLAATGLQPGQTYLLWDAYNPSSPIDVGTYTGAANTIPTPTPFTTLVLTPGPAAQTVTSAPPTNAPIAGQAEPPSATDPTTTLPEPAHSDPANVALPLSRPPSGRDGRLLALALGAVVLALNVWLQVRRRRTSS